MIARVEEERRLPRSATPRMAPHRPCRSGQSRILGLIIPDISNPHFSRVARITERACMAAGYMTFVYNTNEDAEREMQILKMMHMQRVAGLILNSTRSDAAHGARLMAEINVPTVLRGCNITGACPSISSPWTKFGRGTSPPATCSISAIAGSRISPGARAYRRPTSGWRKPLAFADRGLLFPEELVVPGDFSEGTRLRKRASGDVGAGAGRRRSSP